MCDTFGILANSTKNGNTLFGKNSDRKDPDEVQNVVFIPGKSFPAKSEVKCTYISVPQVEKTYDVILSQPFWMFGAEMGVNQYGVSIGNEALYTTEPLSKNGLMGMDMLRLALERSTNAKDALDIIIDLLEAYGQGGNHGYKFPLKYHNSWLIVDKDRGFVLETAGEHWVWKEFFDNYSISNTITIESQYDAISENAVNHAIRKGRCSSEQDFSFKKCYSAKGLKNLFNAVVRNLVKAEERNDQHYSACCQYVGDKTATVQSIMNILRSHYGGTPTPSYSNKDICWHSGKLLSLSQSTNAFITETKTDDLTSIWTTVGSSPCIQLFKPFFLSKNSPNSLPDLGFGYKFYKEGTEWWENEVLHRLVLQNYSERLAVYEKERTSYENKWLEQVNAKIAENGDVHGFSKELHEISKNLRKKWIDAVKVVPAKPLGLHYNNYWQKKSKEDKMP